jgi:hypothetical protein
MSSSKKDPVDKHLEVRLSEALDDVKKGRVQGPFKSAKEVVQSLRRSSKKTRRG